jgi:hypothetical protein
MSYIGTIHCLKDKNDDDYWIVKYQHPITKKEMVLRTNKFFAREYYRNGDKVKFVFNSYGEPDMYANLINQQENHKFNGRDEKIIIYRLIRKII